MTKPIEQRKRDHLVLARDESNQFASSAGFENWRFVHDALPDLNLEDVDTRFEFLGKQLAFPFLISSMSGGVEEASNLNATLAAAAQEAGCAMGLGSIRPVLEHPELGDSFLVARRNAPDIVLLANLGLAQLVQGVSMDLVHDRCSLLGVNGLIIHLNPMQEDIQPEGEPQFERGSEVIQNWVENFPLPIIVKEVGLGLSPDVVQRLQRLGVQWIDLAGAGGTNWIRIEAQRLARDTVARRVADELSEWGEPTAETLWNLPAKTPGIIASGGLNRPLDFAKAIALGASLGGAAKPLLGAALDEDVSAVVAELQVWQETLRTVMFGTGSASLVDFRGNRELLTPLQESRQ